MNYALAQIGGFQIDFVTAIGILVVVLVIIAYVVSR